MNIYRWMPFLMYSVINQSSLQTITSLYLSQMITGHCDQIKTPAASCTCSSVPVGVNEWNVQGNKIPLKSHVKTPLKKQKLDLCRIPIHSTWMIDGLQNSNYKEVTVKDPQFAKPILQWIGKLLCWFSENEQYAAQQWSSVRGFESVFESWETDSNCPPAHEYE